MPTASFKLTAVANEVVISINFYQSVAVSTLLDSAVFFVIQITVYLNDSGFALVHLAVSTKVVITVGNRQSVRYCAVYLLPTVSFKLTAVADEIVILAHFYKAISVSTLLDNTVFFVIQITVYINDSSFALAHLAVSTEVVITVGNW